MRWTSLVVDALRARHDEPATLDLDPGGPQNRSANDLLALTAGFIEAMDQWGVLDGEAVPCLVATGPVAQSLFLAGAVSNRPTAPIGPRLTPNEIVVCLENLAARVLVAERRYAETAHAAGALSGVEVVVIDDEARWGDPESVRPRSADSVVCYLHTSGTTGRAKAVPVTDAQLGARAEMLGRVCDYRDGDVVVAASPFHHIAGLGMVTVAMACGSVVVALSHFAIRDWDRVRALDPTHLALVATHVEMLVAAQEIGAPSLRRVFYGASVLRESTLATLIETRPDIDLIRWYGQTEASPITWLSPQDHRRAAKGEDWLFQTVGSPLPGVEVRINEPAEDGVGEIWARAPHLSVVGEDGWRRTGDLGRLRPDGYLELAGRQGDMIIRGGENVYPIEVEKAILAHPGVSDVVVKGVPDDLLGQRIKAFVQPTDLDDPPSIEELRRFVREQLAGFKVPAEWEFRREFVHNASGKVVRKLIE